MTKRKIKPNEVIDAEKLFNFNKYNCYILGLLWADSHINYNSIALEMIREDLETLKNIFDFTDLPWKIYFRTRENRKPQMTIRLTNKCIAEKLTGYGYKNRLNGPQKLLNELPKHLKKYWFLGYFDGDGHLDVKRNHLAFSSSINQNWDFCLKYFKCGKTSKHVTKINHKYSLLRIINYKNVNKSLKKIFPKIYDIGLKRKRNKYEEFLNKFKAYNKHTRKR